MVHAKSQFLDFLGVRTKDGRAIMIEAKSTGHERLPFGTKKSGITAKQIEAMRLWFWAGAIVGILWECRPLKKIYWIDYQRLRTLLEGGLKRKSLLPGFCQEVDLIFTDAGAFPHLAEPLNLNKKVNE